MLKNLTALIIAASIMSAGALAKSEEERAAEVLSVVQSYLDNLGGGRDERALEGAYGGIEKVWPHYIRTFGDNHALAAPFSLLRARAATVADNRKLVVPAWLYALQLNAMPSNPHALVSLNIEAAHAAAGVKDTTSAKQFFAAARAYSFIRGEDAELSRMHMRIQELNVLGGDMEWRSLRDALLDLRDFSETFAMWTLPRLEAVVSETEIRLKFQPENEEKREALSTLKAEITLIVDGVSDSLPAGFMSRVRKLNYALEDRYQL